MIYSLRYSLQYVVWNDMYPCDWCNGSHFWTWHARQTARLSQAYDFENLRCRKNFKEKEEDILNWTNPILNHLCKGIPRIYQEHGMKVLDSAVLRFEMFRNIDTVHIIPCICNISNMRYIFNDSKEIPKKQLTWNALRFHYVKNLYKTRLDVTKIPHQVT